LVVERPVVLVVVGKEAVEVLVASFDAGKPFS